VPLVAVAYAILAGLSKVVPGSRVTPSTTLMIDTGLWLELYVAVIFLLALGLASLLGSQATTLGVLAGLQLLVTPVVPGPAQSRCGRGSGARDRALEGWRRRSS
jgi:hypothetical protein